MEGVSLHFIGGTFVESHGREEVEIRNPATGAIIGHGILGDAVDAERAIAAAKAAFPAWSRTSLQERRDIFQKLADAVTRRMDEIKAAMIIEFGGTVGFTDYVVAQSRDFFLMAQDLLVQENFQRREGPAILERVPLGVAGLLTPWNGSPWFMCGKTASALAAGCTVVIKPSEMSLLQTQAVMACFADADLPPGIVNVVNGRGDPVGNTITRSPDVQKISFTGSTRVGKQIVRDAAETMKRVTLELGGKSPTIILDDADLDQAVPFALGVGLMNSGQACIAGTRILVPEARLDETAAAIASMIATFKVGLPDDPATQIQPMVSANHYERVQAYIRKGIEEGAEILAGGEGKPAGLEAGNYVKPTVFVNVSNAMTIAQEEIFGPVLSIISYRDDDEAVAIANDVEYGLHAYVHGRDRARARHVADQLLAGRVMINEMVDAPTVPFGGFKLSGLGREFGVYGLDTFLETRAVFDAA